MLNLHDKGLANTVCTFGTGFGISKKNKGNIDKLLQFKYQGIETVYIMYDGDKAGKDAAKKLLENIKYSFNAEIINISDGQDPGGFSKQDVNNLRSEMYG